MDRDALPLARTQGLFAIPAAISTLSTAYSLGKTAYSTGSYLFANDVPQPIIAEPMVTTGVGTLFAMSIMSLGAKYFLSLYGEKMFHGLFKTFMDGVSIKPKKAPPENQNGAWISNLLLQAWPHFGKSFNPNQLKGIKNRALLTAISSITLVWVQYVGATEMRKQVIKRLKRDQGDSKDDDDLLKMWRARKYEDSTFQDVAYYDRVISEGLSEEGKQQAVNEDGWLSKAIHEGILDLYKKGPFYTEENPSLFSLHYFDPSHTHLVRMVLNTLLGMLLQLDFVFSRSGSSDPVKTFSNFLLISGYTEILCRALRLYGWAPLYVAAKVLNKLLLQ